jgi:hypothetical protein
MKFEKVIDTRCSDFQDLGLSTPDHGSNKMWLEKSIQVNNYYNTTYINNAVPKAAHPRQVTSWLVKNPGASVIR